MDLKQQILDILKKENHSFKELAEHLSMSEEELTTALETKKLELRTLELMSKGLKIPLYSFFRLNREEREFERPYYINKLWQDQTHLNKEELKHEINILKEILFYKEDQLKNLEKGV